MGNCGEEKMTLDDVKKAVVHIEEIKGDDESAHSHEDELHQAVLKEIASLNPHDDLSVDAIEMAKEALKTLDIDFSRWCA